MGRDPKGGEVRFNLYFRERHLKGSEFSEETQELERIPIISSLKSEPNGILQQLHKTP